MQTKLAFLVGFLILAFFVLLIISAFSCKPKLLHRYLSVILCLSWCFLYPVLREFCPFWGIGLLVACIIYLARHLWIVDERRHQKNEELWAVLSSNNFETVKSYLSTKPNLKVTDKNENTPIEIALQNNNEKITELLLSHDAEFTPKDLSLAISKNFVSVVDLMLKKGATLTSYDLFLSISNQYNQIATMLLKKGAYGNEALYHAIQNNLIDITEHILRNMKDAKAVIDFPTLLACSIQNNHLEIASMLLREGAYGSNALVLAVQKGLIDIANHIIENIPAGRHLLDTINMLIEKRCDEKYVMMLLNKITKENLLNENHNQCLDILLAALQNDYCDVAQWIIKRKIYDKETKLLAMSKGYTHLMEQMMK